MGAYSREDELWRVAALTPEEMQQDQDYETSPWVQDDLLRSIQTQRDPRLRAILQQTYDQDFNGAPAPEPAAGGLQRASLSSNTFNPFARVLGTGNAPPGADRQVDAGDFNPFARVLNTPEAKPEDDSWAVTRGVKKGLHGMAGAFEGLGGLAAGVVGADDTKQSLMSAAQEQYKQVEALSKPSDELKNLSWENAPAFAGTFAGEQALNLLTILIPGGIEAKVGSKLAADGIKTAVEATAKEATAKYLAQGVLAEDAAKFAAKEAAEKGAQLAATASRHATEGGLFAQFAGQGAGDIYTQQSMQGQDDPLKALGYGAAGAGAAMIGGLPLVNRALSNGLGLDLLSTVDKGFLGNRAVAMGQQAGLMAVGNVGQTAAARAGTNQDVLSPEAMEQYKWSAASGALAGAAFGGVLGGHVTDRPETIEAQKAVVQQQLEAAQARKTAFDLASKEPVDLTANPVGLSEPFQLWPHEQPQKSNQPTLEELEQAAQLRSLGIDEQGNPLGRPAPPAPAAPDANPMGLVETAPTQDMFGGRGKDIAAQPPAPEDQQRVKLAYDQAKQDGHEGLAKALAQYHEQAFGVHPDEAPVPVQPGQQALFDQPAPAAPVGRQRFEPSRPVAAETILKEKQNGRAIREVAPDGAVGPRQDQGSEGSSPVSERPGVNPNAAQGEAVRSAEGPGNRAEQARATDVAGKHKNSAAEVENLKRTVSEDEVAKALAETNADLAAHEGAEPGKPAGKVTLPQQVLHAIARGIAGGVEKSGTPLVYKPKSAAVDKAMTETWGPKIREVIGAARAVARAHREMYNSEANMTPALDASKASGVKKTPGPTAKGSPEQIATTKLELQHRVENLRSAMKDAGGTDADIQAVLAVFKNRVLKVQEKSVKTDKLHTRMDYGLSRSWMMHKNGEFEGASLPRNTPIRTSWELARRGETSPVVKAAEGYAAQPKNKFSKKEPEVFTGAQGVVAYLMRHGNAYERFLSAAIQHAFKTLEAPKLKFADTGRPVYDPGAHEVTLRKNERPDVILHELLHAALHQFVTTHQNHSTVLRLSSALDGVLKMDRTGMPDRVKEVLGLIEGARDNAKTPTAKIRDAVLEFVSYANTDKDFHMWLREQKEMPALSSSVKFERGSERGGNTAIGRLWNAFKDVISRVLGGNEKLAKDVMEETMHMLSMVHAGAKGAAGEGGTANPLEVTPIPARINGLKLVIQKNPSREDAMQSLERYGTTKRFTDPKTGKDIVPDSSLRALRNPKTGDVYTWNPHAAIHSQVKEHLVNEGRYALDELNQKLKAGLITKEGYEYQLKNIVTEDNVGDLQHEYISANGEGSHGDWKDLHDTPTYFKDEQDGNMLYAHVGTEEGARDIAEHGGTLPATHIDYIGKAPKKGILEPLFTLIAPGMYAGDRPTMQKWEQRAAASMENLRKTSPWLAAQAGKFVASANVSEATERIVQIFKTDRNAPVTAANKFMRWMVGSRYNTDAIRRAFAYLDDAKVESGLPKHVEHYIDNARDALERLLASKDIPEEVRAELADLKPSEMLTHAFQADTLASSGLGAQSEKLVAGTKVNHPLDATALPHNGESLKGRYHPVWAEGANKKPIITEMVHESRVNEPAFKDKVRTGETYIMTNKNPNSPQQDARIFRKLTTVDSILHDQSLGHEAARTVAASFLNTVALMSHSVAATKMARDIVSAGYANGKVFDDQDALRGYINAEREKQGLPRLESIHVFTATTTEAKSPKLMNVLRKPGEFVLAPKDPAVYGDIAGKIIDGPTWMRLKDALNRDPVVHFQLYNDMMQLFKSSKTIYSPSTHVTNAMSNFTLAWINGLSWNAVKSGLSLYARYHITPGKLSKDELQIMTDFMRSGATLGDWSHNEAKRMMYEAAEKQGNTAGVGFADTFKAFINYEKHLATGAGKLSTGAARAHELAGELYSAGDNMFRVGAFMSKMGELQKLHPDMKHDDKVSLAGQYAKEAFLDYDIDSRALQTARQVAFPFASWSYAFAGRVAKVAKNEPWHLASLWAAYSIASAVASSIAPPDDKKIRKQSGHDGKTFFGADKEFNIGTTHNGRQIYFDAAHWFMPTPLEFKDAPNGFMGIHSWPSAITPGNPAINTMMLMFGFDPYTGQSFKKESNTDFQNAQVIMKKIGEEMTPPLTKMITSPPTPADVTGKETDTGVAWARKLAVPLTAIGDKEAEMQNAMKAKHLIKAFDADIQSVKHNARIPMPEKITTIQAIQQRKADRIKELMGAP